MRPFLYLPLFALVAACAHQGGEALPMPSEPPPASVDNYVGANVESLPAKAVAGYMASALAVLNKSLATSEGRQWQVSQLADGSIRLLASTASGFETDSAELRPLALDDLDRLARVVRKFDKTIVHVLANGRDAKTVTFSQSLSDRRAAALAAYLDEQGVDNTRLRSEGASKLQPGILQIVIKPIITGMEAQAWMSPS